MKINKCYAVIDKDTGEIVKCSYKYPTALYTTMEEARNALRGYKAYHRVKEKGKYQIEEIILPKINRVVWEG